MGTLNGLGLEQQGDNFDEEMETCFGDEGDRPNVVPTNYLCISKRGAPVNPVKGQFLLDLSLSPPPPSPGIVPGKDRKNLTLHTTSGPITAEIWIKHDGSTRSKPKRVSLDLSSGNGMVRAVVHDSDPSSSGQRALPFLDMGLRANYGDVYLSLPHCFRGPITIRTGDDRVAFSPALGERTALISDVPGGRVYFVGARPRGGKWGTNKSEAVEDSLDDLSVDGRFTSVRINYVGEEEVPVMMPNPWQVFCGGTERFFTIGRVS